MLQQLLLKLREIAKRLPQLLRQGVQLLPQQLLMCGTPLRPVGTLTPTRDKTIGTRLGANVPGDGQSRENVQRSVKGVNPIVPH